QESQLIQKSHQNESLVLSKSQDVAAILEDLQRQDKFMQSLSFSEILKNTWREVKPRTPLSIKQAPFFILSQSQIPSVLVEVGFLSHPRESQQLKNPQYQNEIAVII